MNNIFHYHSNNRTIEQSNISPLTFPHSNIRTIEHSNISPLSFPHSNIRTFEHSNISPYSPSHSNIRTIEHSNISHQGFTLVELLVASILLSMLVTILTMIFNQSAIAWRTGTAGVAQLEDSRRDLGTFHDCRDEALPGLKEKDVYGKSRAVKYRTVSIFRKNNKLRSDRAFEMINWDTAPSLLTAGEQGQIKQIEGGEKVGGSMFIVGVRSAGPNGEFGDEDDITTWPDEVF